MGNPRVDDRLGISDSYSKNGLVLSEVIVWLKAKGLYAECMRDCGVDQAPKAASSQSVKDLLERASTMAEYMCRLDPMGQHKLFLDAIAAVKKEIYDS